MRVRSLLVLWTTLHSLSAAELTLIIDKSGQTIGSTPVLRPKAPLRAADTLKFDLSDFPATSAVVVTYQFIKKIDNGYSLDCTAAKAYDPETPIPIDDSGALYFNIRANVDAAPADKAQLSELQDQLSYYNGLNKPLTFAKKKQIQDKISDQNQDIASIQEEIKAFTAISLKDAVDAIDGRQRHIREIRQEIKTLQKQLDGAGLEDKINQLNSQIRDLMGKIGAKRTLLRAGVIPIGEHRKGVFYSLADSGDRASPYMLKHAQPFPILTTADVPYIVILGQREMSDVQGLRASFTSAAGSYIDVAPVRPLVTQSSVASRQDGIRAFSKATIFIEKNDLNVCTPVVDDTFIDRVLTFTDRLAGETIYSVSVTGYGVQQTSDEITVTTGDSPAQQEQVITNKKDIPILNSEAWPQVHSLFRYNLSTGVLWTTIHAPSFSRLNTGSYLPSGCDPNAVPAACTATYQTVRDPGGPRVFPALMFTVYPWFRRDTQVDVRWKELIPVPTFGLSLMNPTDDFLIGGSSEVKPFRNVQLIYGVHFGRVDKLGPNDGLRLPTDSAAPGTGKSLQTGTFVGLSFNIDFVKGLFGK